MSSSIDLDALDRLNNFIVFDPASQRVAEADILCRGLKVQEYYDDVAFALSESDSISIKIIQNRLSKIEKMLDLVTDYDSLIMTKFVDKIWRRYSSLSHLGELFLDLQTFQSLCPEYCQDLSEVTAQRLGDSDRMTEEDASSEETNNEETNDSKSEEKTAKEESVPV